MLYPKNEFYVIEAIDTEADSPKGGYIQIDHEHPVGITYNLLEEAAKWDNPIKLHQWLKEHNDELKELRKAGIVVIYATSITYQTCRMQVAEFEASLDKWRTNHPEFWH